LPFLRATYFFIAAELILEQFNALQLLAGMISKRSTFSKSSEHKLRAPDTTPHLEAVRNNCHMTQTLSM